MKKLCLLIILVNFIALYSASLPEESIDNIKKSTVYIKVKHKFPLTGDEVPTTGTGFFISKYGHVVTNYHVVQPQLSIYSLTFPAPVTEINIIQNSGSKDHKILPASILTIDKDNDIAVLRIKDSTETPYLTIDSKEKLPETMPIWVFGYPFGDQFTVIQRGPEITVCKGSISALRHDDRGTLSKIQIDAPVNPGNSGGPVTNESGNVIGVVRLLYASGVNFIVPCHFVDSLLKDISLGSYGSGTATLSIKTNPSDVFLFLDWQQKKLNPNHKITATRGWHNISIMKEGYETWMKGMAFDKTQDITVTLPPERNLPVYTGMKKKDTEGNKASYKYESEKLLLKEDFDNPKTFETWEQYTGGTDKRTWFLEKSTLNQFESNEVLHAIYLGDTTWNNYTVKARVKISDEHDDSRAGLIFRETSDGFYLFRIHKETDKAQIAYHCKRPFGWFIIMEKKLDIDITDKWYTIAVNAMGKNISCFLDKKCIFSSQADYSNQGRIGFYSVESKASFDSLTVSEVPDDLLKTSLSYEPGLLSFWFSDYFNLKSTWWYQYTSESRSPVPWHFTDAGCILLGKGKKTRYSEFTKYQLDNFVMNLLVSLGKGDKNSSFEIYFRKNSNGKIALRFSKKDKKLSLLSVKKKKERTIRKISLPPDFFNNTNRLILAINKGKITLSTPDETLLNYSGNIYPSDHGRFGFAASQVPVILHQMTISSVKEKQKYTGGKKAKRR